MSKNDSERPMRSATPPIRKRPAVRADADRAHEQYRGRLRDAVVECVGHEVDERNKQPERANKTRGIKSDEAPRPDGVANRAARRRPRLPVRRRRAPVSGQTATAGIVLDQKRHPGADDDGENPEQQISRAPAQRLDQKAASGGTTRVPTPMPLTARPEAKPRRLMNHRCTAPTAGA